MSSANALATIINIICMPILIRKLGAEEYGVYIYLFIQSQLVLLVSNFSFDAYLIKECTKQGAELREKIKETILARLFLYMVSSFLVFIYLDLIKQIDTKLIVVSLLSVLPLSFNLVWYYQLKEKMHIIAFSNIVGKFIFLLLAILPFNSIEYVFLCWFFCNLVTVFFYFNNLSFNLGSFNVSINNTCKIISKASSIFSFQFFVGVIPSIASNSIVSLGETSYMIYYDIFNKITSAINLILSSFVQSIYPVIAKIKENNKVFLLVTKTTMILFLFFFASYLLVLSFYSNIDKVISYVLGVDMVNVGEVVIASLLFSLFVVLNSLYSRCLILKNGIVIINASTIASLLTVCFYPMITDATSGKNIIDGLIVSQIIMWSIMAFKFYKEYKQASRV
ncbi:oligosaccharide flippase family protein [Vibrio parahaemolyticus]|nr:oligosaccharide flippase family protein [Vibrio parahaemolyticus]MBM5200945.1 oligosaccharide flippase family protein [Vibrio parahaemolyticus]MBM5209761.1 oligosaccharide flippase family protein [Vibrio parahaemolyticus]